MSNDDDDVFADDVEDDGGALEALIARLREARDAPEGVIDPYVQLIGFWDGERPLTVLTYYATHPQSYHGKGIVSGDTVGLARAMRERELPNVAHIHFDGASGNVTPRS